MIKLHQLPKTATIGKKRLGQGLGSGKGKTSGRGTKGQSSRGKIAKALGAAGTILVRRLPLYRGKYRNKPRGRKAYEVNIKYLNILPKDSVVDVETIKKYHILDANFPAHHNVKILGEGKLEVVLCVNLPVSKGAAKKITDAGGKVNRDKKSNSKTS